MVFDARDGDRDAFRAVVEATEPAVRRFLAFRVGRHDIDDVVQETYIRAWRSLHRFQGRASATTWVLSIARCAAADLQRDDSRHRRRIEAAASFVSLPSVGHDEHHALSELIAGLDESRRDAFVLTQVVGLSYEEAATVVGVALGTIRSRVARARADLVSLLEHRDEVAAV